MGFPCLTSINMNKDERQKPQEIPGYKFKLEEKIAFLYHHLLLSLLLPLCYCADSLGQYCVNEFKSNQTQANIGHVLADLVARAPLDGFAVSTYGKNTNTVYGLAQCREDVSTKNCSSCISAAAKELPNNCPKQADARIWYEYCFLRYDNQNFVGQVDAGFALLLVNNQNATDPENFDKALGTLLSKVKAQAVIKGNRGLGRGNTQFSPNVIIYGLAQCTRDLPQLSCAQCLSSALAVFQRYCRYRKGCQIDFSSCLAKYEIFPFFNSHQSAQVGTYKRLILQP